MPTLKRHRSKRSRSRSRSRSPNRTKRAKNNNLTNENVENVYVVNTSGPEWRIKDGNEPNYIIPENLKYKGPKSDAPLKTFGKLPAFSQNK